MSSPQADGAPLILNGKVFKRLISAPQVQPDIKPYKSVTLPKRLPGCHTDPKGYCIISLRKQEAQVAKEFL